MIYETAFVLKPTITEEDAKKVRELVTSSIEESKGEVLINDSWGVMNFAQPTAKGESKGQYFYVMFKSDGHINNEIERRLKINENVLKWLVVKLGTDKHEDEIKKSYQNPNHENADENRIKLEKERKILSKRRSCWFSATKTQPDWKNPRTYSWLVNEFGKISPGRVTGLRPRYQRMATTAIKRGRMMGFISYVTGDVSYRA
ncbi:MAG: 30S ribosomal protein S6 [Halobacteriovoraceae bacterium]|nr:30S ribosomal protein S6 [Halobacteriovoraceae bacterium]MCB9093958.1 30S ribosomal protein S6 [Halobacteriovoraceae bacterium]